MLILTPDLGVPMPDGAGRRGATANLDLYTRAKAACNSALDLTEYGLFLDPIDEDQFIASTLVRAYAKDPEKTSKTVSNSRASQLRPESMVLVGKILDEFGHQLVDNSMRIRNLIINKLLIETEHSQARVRLKALELLGKISDVGIFVDKSEVTVTHKSSDELRDQLRNKLHRLIDPEEEHTVVDAEFVEDLQNSVKINNSHVYDHDN